MFYELEAPGREWGRELGKTKVEKKTLSPVWTTPVSFKTSSPYVVAGVWDKDAVSKDDPMGNVVFSTRAAYAHSQVSGGEVSLDFFTLNGEYFVKGKRGFLATQGGLDLRMKVGTA